MIADAPSAAAESLEGGLLSKVAAFVAAAKSTAADGLTWSEFGELMVALLRLVVTFLDSVSTKGGAETESLALPAVGSLFDAVADKAVPLAAWPLWILVRPSVRSLVLAIAAGSIESMLPLVRK